MAIWVWKHHRGSSRLLFTTFTFSTSISLVNTVLVTPMIHVMEQMLLTVVLIPGLLKSSGQMPSERFEPLGSMSMPFAILMVLSLNNLEKNITLCHTHLHTTQPTVDLSGLRVEVKTSKLVVVVLNCVPMRMVLSNLTDLLSTMHQVHSRT